MTIIFFLCIILIIRFICIIFAYYVYVVYIRLLIDTQITKMHMIFIFYEYFKFILRV